MTRSWPGAPLGALLPWQDQAVLVLQTIVWVFVGVVVFALAFWVMAKLSPFSIRKEIEQDQNSAMAIIMAAVILGIALIVAAAIHG